ncbi:MAG: hypothetical protein AB7T86_07950 [Xanthobacteraceae bacterium]|uniref:hypothetical protein n=1 Tax=Pseudolabrys sp. TaxID=1960880 RepID=UPI003D0F368E
MEQLIRSDDDIEDAAADHGFGSTPQLVPPRPNAALTALVTGMMLAICIVVAATAMSFGRVESGHATGPVAERSLATVTQPLSARG